MTRSAPRTETPAPTSAQDPSEPEPRRTVAGRLRLCAGAVVVSAPFVMGAAAAPDGRAPVEEFVVRDHLVAESSGLTVQQVDGERLFTTVNDSGDSGRVFTVDPTTGDTVGVTRWAPDPRDVEALAPDGDDHVWVGDIGDNRHARDHVTVTRVPVGRGERTVADAESYDLVYEGGGRDAEALLRHPTTGRLHVVTKNLFGGELYEAPAELDPDAPNLLRPLGRVPAIVTDGAFAPDGETLVLRTYTEAYVLAWPELTVLHRFELPRQPQGEGLAVSAEGDVFVSTEGRQRPVLRVELPEAARADVTTAADRFDPRVWWERMWEFLRSLRDVAAQQRP